MRIPLASGLLILLATGTAFAGPFERRLAPAPSSARFPRLAAVFRAPNSATTGYTPQGPLPPQQHPRLAALAMPGGFWTPGFYSPPVNPGGPVRAIPRVVMGTLDVIGYFPTPLYFIGSGATVAIRLTNVTLNGSPTPGRPLDTLLFIASPWSARIRDSLRDRRMEKGLPPLIGRPPLDAGNVVPPCACGN